MQQTYAPILLNSGNLKIIYCDGGSYNNGDRKGTGSYAFLEPVDLSCDIVDIYGEYFTDTTNNRTEMLAAINGIKFIDKKYGNNPQVQVISDSGYLVKSYSDPAYLDRWIQNGWITSTKTPVLNKDLWEELLKVSWHIRFIFEHIRGHKKDRNHLHAFWNDIADGACTFIMNKIPDAKPNVMYHLQYSISNKKFKLIGE